MKREQDITVLQRRRPADESTRTGDRASETPKATFRDKTSVSPPIHLIEKYQFLILILWVLAAVSVGRIAWRSIVPLEPAAVVVGIDPNTAPWWDLTALPGVGKITAKNIIAYRASVQQTPNALDADDMNSRMAPFAQALSSSTDIKASSVQEAPAFSNPMDLTRVRGIGPRTVQRMASHLRFDNADPESTPTTSVE